MSAAATEETLTAAGERPSQRPLILRFCRSPPPRRDLLVGVDDDETMTEAQIDAEFERTQPIGNAINALAQAELAVAAVDELPPDVQTHLDQMLRDGPGQAND